MGVLLSWCREHGARLVGSGLRYAIDERTGRMPDLSVFLAGAPRPPARGPAHGPPSIAIEVVSATPSDARRDRIEKLSEYARFGVRWYWLVDPELRSLEVLELDDEHRYVHIVNATGGEVTAVPGCPGLVVDVDALWRELDEVIAESGEG
jgi:Uma2 family endonuclease